MSEFYSIKTLTQYKKALANSTAPSPIPDSNLVAQAVASSGSPSWPLIKELLTIQSCWVPLLENPNLSKPVFDRLALSAAHELLLLFPDSDFQPPARQELFAVFKKLTETARLVPGDPAFALLATDASAIRSAKRSDNYERWLAFDIIIRSPRLPARLVSRLARQTCPTDPNEAGRRIRLALYPARTKNTYRHIALSCTCQKTAEGLAWDQEIRTDALLKDWFMGFSAASLTIQGAMLAEADDAKVKNWFRAALGLVAGSPSLALAKTILKTLDHVKSRAVALLSPQDLSPLVMHADKEIRLAATTFLSHWRPKIPTPSQR